MSREDADAGFLSRWSRLKREGGEPAEAEAVPSGAVPDARPDTRPDARPDAGAQGDAPGKTDAEILEELGLPDPDALRPGDDVRGFMAEAVPARLRSRALRKLWVGNPVLANLDELVDYGEDFTDAATVVENLASAWQVGRGYLIDPDPEPRPDREAPPAQDVAEDGEDGVTPAAVETAGRVEDGAEGADGAQAAAQGSAEAAVAGDPPEPVAPRPRRMVFSFDDGGHGA